MEILLILFAVIIIAAAATVALLSLSGVSIRDMLTDEQRLVVPYTSPSGLEPHRAHPTDAGADLCLANTVVLQPGDRKLAGTGVHVAIPEGYVGLLVPRSSLPHKYGVTLANSPGIIDSDYRGEIKLNLLNIDRKQIILPAGQRVAQLLIMPVELAQFRYSDTLPDTVRGDGGHGSTGTGAAA